MFVSVIPKEIEILFRFSPEELDWLIIMFKKGTVRYDDEEVPEEAIVTLTNFVKAVEDVQKELRDGA